MKLFVLSSALLLFVSCSSQELLEVKQFTVKETQSERNNDLMIRGESQKRLYGAINEREREARLGQYYSVRWRAHSQGGPVKIQFQYRQANTGSKIHSLWEKSKAKPTGLTEFSINGGSYQKLGRVTSWRIRLYQQDSLLAEEQSFLWQ